MPRQVVRPPRPRPVHLEDVQVRPVDFRSANYCYVSASTLKPLFAPDLQSSRTLASTVVSRKKRQSK